MQGEIPPSTLALKQEVERLKWVHTIDLGNGIVTPGKWGAPSQIILRAFGDIDFVGRKVLDIGCWDGLWSFEAERRGAREVYATDYVSHRWGREDRTFDLAKRALGSRARYLPDISVYEIPQKLAVCDFDVVLFCGVFYHLKNPLLGITRLRQVMKEGGVILVEGDAIDDERSYARFCYREWHAGDKSNWWVPTVSCIKQWVECSFFEVLHEYRWRDRDTRIRRLLRNTAKAVAGKPKEGTVRYALTARAVRRKDRKYAYPDPDLVEFDLNEYR